MTYEDAYLLHTVALGEMHIPLRQMLLRGSARDGLDLFTTGQRGILGQLHRRQYLVPRGVCFHLGTQMHLFAEFLILFLSHSRCQFRHPGSHLSANCFRLMFQILWDFELLYQPLLCALLGGAVLWKQTCASVAALEMMFLPRRRQLQSLLERPLRLECSLCV